MKSIVRMAIQSFFALAAVIALSSCSTVISPNGGATRPNHTLWEAIVEIHGNTSVVEYPEHCLIRSSFYYRYADLRAGMPIIYRTGDTTGLGVLGTRSAEGSWTTIDGQTITRNNFLGKANNLFAKISPGPIPVSYWDHPVPGTVRVLVECRGKSMLPVIPEQALVTATFGYPYEALQEGDMGVFWNSATADKSYTNHRLVTKWLGDGSFTAQGINNAAPDICRINPKNFVARTHKVYGLFETDVPAPARDVGTTASVND